MTTIFIFHYFVYSTEFFYAELSILLLCRILWGMTVCLYMPFMHSESLIIHELAVVLYQSDPGLENNLNFELKHKVIIERFGRYPHRNTILGRVSSEEEKDFLQQPGSSF